ncbi:MAG TPA: endonuclease III [Candidatus Acetothermia bacterium]|nr:endonuclease III [Candidatus Acetothermia bacterium]
MGPHPRLAEAARRLRLRFGPPAPCGGERPLDLLVRTILSQNTSDRNRDHAYAELRRRFSGWEDVLAAPEGEVAQAIQGAGLHRQRARRLKEVLERLQRERGTLSLDFLSELPDKEAARWLLSLPGVGKKTAYVVLLFGFDRPFFPVDTHIARVTRRLGLVTDRGDPHDALAPLVPTGGERELHLHLIRLGREICRPRRPRCAACPLLDLCPHGRKETQ